MSDAVVGSLLGAALGGPTVLMLASAATTGRSAAGRADVAAVTTLTGLTVGFVLARPPAVALVLLPLAVLGCAAAVVDAREGRLPDRLTVPLLGCTLLATLASGDVRAVAVAAAATAVATLAKTMASAAIGWGDVKLVPPVTLVLAHHGALLQGVVLACTLVAITAVAIGLVDRCARTRSEVIPYGPALLLGTVGAAVF